MQSEKKEQEGKADGSFCGRMMATMSLIGGKG